MKPAAAMAAARAQATAAGCRCRPDVIYRPAGLVDVHHDPDCVLAGTGSAAVLVGGGITPVVFDITSAMRLAVTTRTVVMFAAEAVLLAAEGVDFPPMIAEFFDIEQHLFDGTVVRVASMPDHMVADLERQVGLR